MAALRIAVYPTADGEMKAEILSEEHCHVVQGVKEPNYYWTLDLTDQSEAESLIIMAKNQLQDMQLDTRKLKVMTKEELHCTLR